VTKHDLPGNYGMYRHWREIHGKFSVSSSRLSSKLSLLLAMQTNTYVADGEKPLPCADNKPTNNKLAADVSLYSSCRAPLQ
jgi:hypothetical protein